VEDNSSKLGLASAIIGAVGAIAAAVLPIYFNRPAADPAPAAEANAAPSVAKADPAPAVAKAVSAPAAAKAVLAPAAAKPTRDPGHKGIAAVVPKAGVARDGAMPKGPAARPSKAQHKAFPTDLARLQGDWAVAEQTNAAKVRSKEDLARTKPVWEFDGNKVTVRNHGDARRLVYFQGSIKLHPDLSPKNFDYSGTDRNDRAFEMLGIYTFDGPVLVLRYQIHHVGDAGKPSRPDSFKIEPRPGSGSLVRLRRAKE